MKLYLDTEFNGHGGELISMAFAAEDGKHWYGILPEPRVWNGWCHEHVLPFLHKMPATVAGTPELVRLSLHQYLDARSPCIVYADWPGDFRCLMAMMEGPEYEQTWIVECDMRLMTESNPQPEFPHNALSDAIALMHWHANASQ